MNQTISTLRKHITLERAIIVVVLIAFYFYNTDISPIRTQYESSPKLGMAPSSYMGRGANVLSDAADESFMPASNPSSNRKMTLQSDLSISVESVAATVTNIQKQAEQIGGYLVGSSVNTPGEVSSGSITVRVPTSSLDDFYSFVKEQALQVVSENKSGQDITEAYEDIDKRLATLTRTQQKLEQIFEETESSKTLLDVQQQILEVQQQIDALKGRKQAMDQRVEYSLVNVQLSTDAYALPYAPEEPWSPSRVLKDAIRSLITTMRGLASTSIWVVVYAPLWGPMLLLYLGWKYKQQKK